MQPKVFINILGFNSKKYLNTCLESVFGLDYDNFTVVYLDNNSTDDSLEYIKSNFSEGVRVVDNKKNLGYAGGHNAGIKLAKNEGAEFVVCLNPDIILPPGFLQQAINGFKKDKIAAVTGKLLKWKFGEQGQEVVTNIIDSTGLEIRKDRSVIDRGEGEEDKGQYDENKEIFGVSGASPIFRIKALEDVKYKGTEDEYFDKDFFLYKEDVDLAYRLQLAGWRARYVPGAVAYHERQMAGSKSKIKNKKEQGKFGKAQSWQNNIFLLGKNEFGNNLLPHLHLVLGRQIKIWSYVLFFEPGLLPNLFKALSRLPYFMNKRRLMPIRISSQDFRQWLR